MVRVATSSRIGKLESFSTSRRMAVPKPLPLSPRGSADHAYLPDRKLLILPRMMENKVTAYDLSE